MVISLIQNISILLALSICHSFILLRWKHRSLVYDILTGFLFGSVCIAGMMTPFVFSQGVIFDGRSLVACMAGLFGGPVTAAILFMMGSAYRVWLGGGGALMGVLVLLSASGLGVICHYIYNKRPEHISFIHLYLLGLLVHICMVLLMMTLPGDVRWKVMASIGPPVLIIYPFGTVLLGKLLSDQIAGADAYQALRISEKNYRELVESANSIILRLDTEGRIRFINEFAQKFFEYSEDEILGKHAVGTIIPEVESTGRDLRNLIVDIVSDVENYVSNENENMRKNGERVWVAWANRLIYDENGGVKEILSVGNDITKRKQTESALARVEDELKESEEKYRILFEGAGDSFVLLNLEGEIVDFNPKAHESLEYTREEFQRMQISDICILETHEAVMQHTKYILKNGVDIFESKHKTKSGKVLDVLVNVRPITLKGKIYLCCIWTDITGQKQAEIRATEEREKLFAVLSNTADLVAAMDKDYNILFMSGKLVEQLGDQTNKKCYQAFCGFDKPCGINCAVDEILRKNKDIFEYMHDDTEDIQSGRIQGKPAKMKEMSKLLTVARPFEYQGKRCVVEVSEDITARYRAENEKKALEEQLLQAQKMEAVGQLAGGVAHDFNNLLQGILGYTDLILMDVPENDSHRRDLEEVKKAAQRAATLTRQLLAFSRRQTMRLSDLQLNQIITDLSKLLQRTIGEHIELNLRLKGDLKTVHADPAMVEQVLLNLCINARDAMPNRGKLTIRTTNAQLDEEFCTNNRWAEPGDYVSVTVSDTGQGIPEDIVERIFEPFFTTKEVGKGSGLGLATVYGIIKQHGGFINCESELGHGADFTFYLPSVERPPQNEIKPEESDDLPRGTETILYAEDEAQVRELGKRILEEYGYTVLLARDGDEAIALFEKEKDVIDLALLDVIMPKRSGREVHDWICRSRKNLPVLFSSGYDTKAVDTGFVLAQNMRLLQKPYSPKQILRKIREVLDASQ